MKKLKKSQILNVVIFLIFIAVLTFATVKYLPTVTALISDPDQFREFVLSYGPISVLVFVLMQILQVVISAIPGEMVQIGGGYIYGTWLGAFINSFGILLGCVIALYSVRILGLSVVKLFVPEKHLTKFDFLVNGKRSDLLLFILFLIPGLPKDTMTYLAGLTAIKPRRFFIITTIARFPGILVSSFVGANLHQQNYTEVIVASVISVIILVGGFIYKEKLVTYAKGKSAPACGFTKVQDEPNL